MAPGDIRTESAHVGEEDLFEVGGDIMIEYLGDKSIGVMASLGCPAEDLLAEEDESLDPEDHQTVAYLEKLMRDESFDTDRL